MIQNLPELCRHDLPYAHDLNKGGIRVALEDLFDALDDVHLEAYDLERRIERLFAQIG